MTVSAMTTSQTIQGPTNHSSIMVFLSEVAALCYSPNDLFHYWIITGITASHCSIRLVLSMIGK